MSFHFIVSSLTSLIPKEFLQILLLLYFYQLLWQILFLYNYDQLSKVSSSPGGSDGKESACNKGDVGSVPGLGRSPGEGNGNSP